MTARQPPDAQPGFDPADLAPGEICIIHFATGNTTRAEFVRCTRNPDWFIVRRWNPHERRWAINPVRMHRNTFIGRPG